MSEPEKDSTEAPLRFPTPFQKKTMWNALTASSMVVIGLIAVGLIALVGKVLGFLQPVLVPIAVAGIIAYLLDPVIGWLTKRGIRHNRAMMSVYVTFMLMVVLLIVLVVVPSVGQAKKLSSVDWPTYQEQAVSLVKVGYAEAQEKLAFLHIQEYVEKGIDAVSEIGPKIGTWLWDKISGIFGIFGYLLGMLLVPVYLFFFLREGHSISETWSDYLPLKASDFKDEVVSTLKEVNQYLISFFRGQMVVSMIDGALVAIVLQFIGLPYALLIGVFLAILGLIPYIGNLMVMVPAMLIALAYFGASEKGIPVAGQTATVGEYAEIEVIRSTNETDAKTVTDGTPPQANGEGAPAPVMNGKKEIKRVLVTSVSEDNKSAVGLTHAWKWLPNVWAYPLIVLGVFVVLQQINGLVTAPKIVGDSVGLHPLTVIFSVLFWSLMLGGLLGALLAVPLTAAVKVLFRRYIWERRIESKLSGSRKTENPDASSDPDDQGIQGSPGESDSPATT